MLGAVREVAQRNSTAEKFVIGRPNACRSIDSYKARYIVGAAGRAGSSSLREYKATYMRSATSPVPHERSAKQSKQLLTLGV